MKSKWLLIFATALFFSSCQAQEKKEKDNKITDVKKAPKENIIVNKEYDKDGNLIRYDSTYAYFYSNIENDTIAEDSILVNFRRMLENRFPFFHSPHFNDLFFEDSLMKYDFYKEDFFFERYKQNMDYLEKLFHEMDSIKNKFFQEQFSKK